MSIHEELAAGRWFTWSLTEQLANIGSEVDRAIRAAAAGRTDRRDRTMERALELFDLTARHERWRGHAGGKCSGRVSHVAQLRRGCRQTVSCSAMRRNNDPS